MGQEWPRPLDDPRGYRRRLYHWELRAVKAGHDLRGLLRPPDAARHDPYRVLHVPPGSVTQLVARRLPSRVAGHLLAGDWDRDLVPLPATALHRGLSQRFLEGRDWAETALHPSRYTRLCCNEPPQYERYSEAEFLRRGAALDRLYGKLARHGFVGHRSRGEPVGAEMTVAISRDGILARHSGGMHRLIMAQFIGLPEVPVRVFAVHAWCLGTDRDPFRRTRGDSMSAPTEEDAPRRRPDEHSPG